MARSAPPKNFNQHKGLTRSIYACGLGNMSLEGIRQFFLQSNDPGWKFRSIRNLPLTVAGLHDKIVGDILTRYDGNVVACSGRETHTLKMELYNSVFSVK